MISNGQTVTTRLFLDALKVLNPALRVYSTGSNSLAGLYLLDKTGNYEAICGVDKVLVPAYARFDDGGHIIKSGWRRVFWILLGNGYTTKEKIQKVCRGFFDSRAYKADRFVGGIAGDPVDNKLLAYSLENENEAMSDEQILDVAETVRAKDTQHQKEEREHDKWFLETWKKRGGDVKDRPNY